MTKPPILRYVGFFVIALVFLGGGLYLLRNHFLIYVFGQETPGVVTNIVNNRRNIRVDYCYNINQEKYCTDQRLQKGFNFHSYAIDESIGVRYYKNNPYVSAMVGTKSQVGVDLFLLFIGGLFAYRGVKLVHHR